MRILPQDRCSDSVEDSRTNANDEAKDAEACEDVPDEVGLAGTNECGGLSVVLVIIR